MWQMAWSSSFAVHFFFKKGLHGLCNSDMWQVAGKYKVHMLGAISKLSNDVSLSFCLHSFAGCIIGPGSWQRGLMWSHRALLTQRLAYLCSSLPAAISVCVFTLAVSSGGKGEFISVMLWQLRRSDRSRSRRV